MKSLQRYSCQTVRARVKKPDAMTKQVNDVRTRDFDHTYGINRRVLFLFHLQRDQA